MTDPALAQYFKEAASWDQDRAAMVARRARIAWCVAGGAGLVAMLSGAALLALLPLKSVQAFVIRVDARTGIVDTVPMYVGTGTHSETVTRYLLTHYVLTCQRYAAQTAESDYFECGAFHTVRANQAWAALWNRSNPRSPLNLYGDEAQLTAHVNAVTFLKKDEAGMSLAQVRYFTAERRGDGDTGRITHYIATIEYAYGAPSTDPERRLWNPLGFRIEKFSAEVEAVSDDSATLSDSSGGAS